MLLSERAQSTLRSPRRPFRMPATKTIRKGFPRAQKPLPTAVRILGLGLLFAMGCARTPDSALRAQRLGSAPSAAAAPGSASGPAADTPSAPVSDSDAAGPTIATEGSRAVKGWFCFSWVHGRDFASPCFSKAHACARAFAKDAHQDKKPCSEYNGTVTCPPESDAAGTPNAERCFQEAPTNETRSLGTGID